MKGRGKRITQAVALIICTVILTMEAMRYGIPPEEIPIPDITTEVIVLQETLTREITPPKEESKEPQTRIFTLCEAPLEEEFQIWLAQLCEENDVNLTVIIAMAAQESNFDPHAVGAQGELGMWQINPQTAAEVEEILGRRLNLFNPYDSAQAAVYLMSRYQKDYGDVIKALMAYSMGEAGAKRELESAVPQSKYAVSVMQRAEEYKETMYEVEKVTDDV